MKKFFAGLLASAVGLVAAMPSVSAATTTEYVFPTNGVVAAKIQKLELPAEPNTPAIDNIYVLTVGLRTNEGQKIHQLEGTLEVDPTIFDMKHLAANLETDFVKGDAFSQSSSDMETAQIEKGIITFKGNTDVGLQSPSDTGVDAFSVVLKVRADNTKDKSTVTIKSENFRVIDTDTDPQANLFSGSVTAQVDGLPVSQTAPVVETPVVEEVTPVVEPVVEPVIEEIPVVEEVVPEVVTPVEPVKTVEDKTAEVKTGPAETMLGLLAVLTIAGLFVTYRKAQ